MEIKIPLELDEQQESLLDMHSVLNVLNVINYELTLINDHAGDEELLHDLMDQVAQAGEWLSIPDKAIDLVADIGGFIDTLESKLDEACSTLSETALKELKPRRENIRTITSILRIRAGEIMARHQLPGAWVDHAVIKLKGNFGAFLSAVERNSHGRYRIVQNMAAKEEGDYLITFEISSDHGDKLRMPIIFQDVMRDLLANARKYTPPGGSIHGGLHAGKDGLRFLIEDSGVGIPAEHLEDVVLFGKRAPNVADRETRGGGFGLTKAYYITRQFEGRMWIESTTPERSSEHGTRIEIFIPYARNQ